MLAFRFVSRHMQTHAKNEGTFWELKKFELSVVHLERKKPCISIILMIKTTTYIPLMQ